MFKSKFLLFIIFLCSIKIYTKAEDESVLFDIPEENAEDAGKSVLNDGLGLAKKKLEIKVLTNSFSDDETGQEAEKINEVLKGNAFFRSYFKFFYNGRENIVRLGFDGFGNPLDAIKPIERLNPFEIFIYKILLLINYASMTESETFKPKYKFFDIPAMLSYLFSRLNRTIDIDKTIEAHSQRAEDMDISPEEFKEINTFSDLIKKHVGLYDRSLVRHLDFSNENIDRMLSPVIKELFQKTKLNFNIGGDEQIVPLNKFLLGLYESYKMIDDVDFYSAIEEELDKYKLSSISGMIIFEALNRIFDVNKKFVETAEGKKLYQELIVGPAKELRKWEDKLNEAKNKYENEIAKSPGSMRLGAYSGYMNMVASSMREKEKGKKEYTKKLLFFSVDGQESIWKFLIKAFSWVKKQSLEDDFSRIALWLKPLENIGFDLKEFLSRVSDFFLSDEFSGRIETYSEKIGAAKKGIKRLLKGKKSGFEEKKREAAKETSSFVDERIDKIKKKNTNLSNKVEGFKSFVKKFKGDAEESLKKIPKLINEKKEKVVSFVQKKKEEKKEIVGNRKKSVKELSERAKKRAAEGIESKKQSTIKNAQKLEERYVSSLDKYGHMAAKTVEDDKAEFLIEEPDDDEAVETGEDYDSFGNNG